MHINWQVCSLIVQAKGEHVQDISTQLAALSTTRSRRSPA